MERSNGEERTENKCRKDKDHDLQYGTGPPTEFRRVSMRRLSHWSGQQQHLLQWLQALGAQEMQWTLTTDVHHARELHAPWMAAQKEVQVRLDKLEMVASFCYLGNMLSAAGGCELSTTTRVKTAWKGSATSSLFMPHLFQNMWPCVQLLCAECNAPCQRDLAIDKAKTPASAAK